MLRQIGELESIGDVCYKTARTIQHLRDGRSDFNTQQYSRLHEMMQLVNEALTQMMVIVSGRREDLSIDASQDIERDINNLRARLGKRFLTFRSLQINLDRKTVSIDGQPVNLTRTEFDLLVLLLKNRGNVLSRQQLMDAVWAGVIVTDRTLNVHITRLRKKIGTYARHIVSRQGFGYVFEVE